MGLNISATLISNMKFLVLFACVDAASAVNLVTYPNGAVAPAKTPEVIAAEAAHFAAGGIAYAGYPYGYALVGYANGAIAPAKTPEVVAAEAAHFAAHGIAAPVAYAAGYPYAHLGFAGLVG